MPVGKKICDLYINSPLGSSFPVSKIHSLTEAVASFEIEPLYKEVVKIIKWLNKNKKE